MAKTCKKCGYSRKPGDRGADYACPQCGAVYAKVEAHLRGDTPQRRQEQREAQERERKKAAMKASVDGAKKQVELGRLSICTECGYLGKPKRMTRGSIFIEIILWVAFLVPGLIYSIWRLTTRYQACPQCAHETVVPATSPRGQALMKEFHADHPLLR